VERADKIWYPIESPVIGGRKNQDVMGSQRRAVLHSNSGSRVGQVKKNRVSHGRVVNYARGTQIFSMADWTHQGGCWGSNVHGCHPTSSALSFGAKVGGWTVCATCHARRGQPTLVAVGNADQVSVSAWMAVGLESATGQLRRTSSACDSRSAREENVPWG